jgi:hypothetical protein
MARFMLYYPRQQPTVTEYFIDLILNLGTNELIVAQAKYKAVTEIHNAMARQPTFYHPDILQQLSDPKMNYYKQTLDNAQLRFDMCVTNLKKHILMHSTEISPMAYTRLRNFASGHENTGIEGIKDLLEMFTTESQDSVLAYLGGGEPIMPETRKKMIKSIEQWSKN